MALDKQKILNELGSVMNQLQSADCGCMGKIFSHQPGGGYGYAGHTDPTRGSPLPTCGGCRRGYCHGHGYATHAAPHAASHATAHAGEPYNTNMNQHCMGQCNPPKLYADTYNYLNHNLMQPVVNEVYNDLKSLTPENTIVNNPMGQQMGLAQGGGQGAKMAGQGGAGYQQMGNQPMGNQQLTHEQVMSGMGRNIMNMMAGDSNKGKHQLGQPMPPPGQVGGMQSMGNAGLSTGIPNAGNQQMQNPMTQNANNAVNPYSQNTVNANMQEGGASGTYHFHPTNPAAQQMAGNKSYGQHTQGMTKFNEMFPGVTNGDLGFDPMSIAMQMNPANQQKCAMDTIHKIMAGEKTNKVMDNNAREMLKPAIAGANAAAAALAAPTNQQMPPQNQQLLNQQPTSNQGDPNNPGNQIPQQQVYTALTGAPTMQQGQSVQQQQPPQMQQEINPNTGSDPTPIPTENYEANAYANQPLPTGYPPQQVIKEPILPAAKNKVLQPTYAVIRDERSVEYNTLGQPVEMIPASVYNNKPYATNMPQTLSPQPVTNFRKDIDRFGVKNTVSKTSLMGLKPVGRTPSRNQLQRIYNQYKGSQSMTQQNISPMQGGTTYSERNLPRSANQPRDVPMERVGGDTVANQLINESLRPVKENPIGRAGDVPADMNKPHGDAAPNKTPMKKQRNGLQDIVFSSYPTSQAWSFHGGHRDVITAPNYRYR